MAPRKRGRDEMEASEGPKEMSILERIRNMWEFASTMQFIFLFGKALKIDEDFDIEDFETECLKPGYSEKLEEIGLTLLKWISSHRGLNHDIWDEYTRRQYLAKAPHLNPYGEDEEPKKFRDFDIFTKIRILHQLTVWTFWNPDRLRERMPDHQREVDQLEWRIEELGYDREDRQYYLLDDNRLYRRTEPPLPPLPKAKAKANTLKAKAERRRANKRRRIVLSETPDATATEDEIISHIDDGEDVPQTNGVSSVSPSSFDTFGGYKWECIAISLAQYHELCDSLKKSRDPNEKALRERLLESVLPTIEAAEEKQRRKIERRERELLTLEKLATAKRSSRIADKQERERHEREAAEAQRKHARDLAEAHRQQELQDKMDRERQSRMMTREQRIKEREYKRLLMEEELVRASEEAKKLETGEGRGSERQLKDKMARAQKNLEQLQGEDEWTFDCSGCGMHGKNLDDGSHSVACEKCNVWQHSKCLGISEAAAEDENFHFVCKDCKRRAEEANRPKIMIKVRNPESSSPSEPRSNKPHPKPQPIQKPSDIEVVKKRPVGRPPKHPPTANGVPQSLPNQSPPAEKKPIANGYLYYTSRPSPTPFVTQYPPYPNGYPQPRVGSSSSSPQAQPPTQLQNGYAARPGTSGAQPFPSTPYFQAGSAQNPESYAQYPQYYNGIPHQYQPYHPGPRPSQSPAPRPMSTHEAPAGARTANAGLAPSPVFNRPTISPTQGNYDVGPVAGLQQRSPIPSYQVPYTSPSQQQPRPNSTLQQSPSRQSHPSPMTFTPQMPTSIQLSGISPIKHSPIPHPSAIPQKLSLSPPPPQGSPPQQKGIPSTVPPASSPNRTFSGTSVFPPAQQLSPSPEQLHRSPVPTPVKQPSLSTSISQSPSNAEPFVEKEESKTARLEMKENVMGISEKTQGETSRTNTSTQSMESVLPPNDGR